MIAVARLAGSVVIAAGCTMAAGYLWQSKTPRLDNASPYLLNTAPNTTIQGHVDWITPDGKSIFLKSDKDNLLPPFTLGHDLKLTNPDGSIYDYKASGGLTGALQGKRIEFTLKDKSAQRQVDEIQISSENKK